MSGNQGRALAFRHYQNGLPLDSQAILNALAMSVLVVDDQDCLRYMNGAAEDLFQSSIAHLFGHPLKELLPEDSPVFGLLRQGREHAISVSEYDLTIDTPRTGRRVVTAQVSPIVEVRNWLVLALLEQSIAARIGNQFTHRNAARSVTAMAAILAHEVKNPLSGIRGAAQLLENGVGSEDRALTQLICDETDRICALVDRMDMFSEKANLVRSAVNIHRVLEHVRRIAENGFGKHVRIVELYDPSLPPVHGDKDQLIQVFLNLVKNAAEAAPKTGGEIVIATSFQQGVRLAVPGTNERTQLPLLVTIQDNGPGIPEELKPHLFEPFVTTKATGSGLGLALVAKIVDDHGGMIEFDSQPRRTLFRVFLPMIHGEEEAP